MVLPFRPLLIRLLQLLRQFPMSIEIHRTLAQRMVDEQCEIPLIAETGGQNAMIVDSSALPEQVVKDTIHSAFLSAGQRCSALRVLYLQEDIADKTVAMLRGAMRELVIGDPALLGTDVGPVIDEEARARLEQHAASIKAAGRPIEHLAVPDACRYGTYFAPCAVEIDRLEQLENENFGAMLHVIRYARRDLDAVIVPNFGTMNVLGMNFLRSLGGWRVEGNYLVLQP